MAVRMAVLWVVETEQQMVKLMGYRMVGLMAYLLVALRVAEMVALMVD